MRSFASGSSRELRRIRMASTEAPGSPDDYEFHIGRLPGAAALPRLQPWRLLGAWRARTCMLGGSREPRPGPNCVAGSSREPRRVRTSSREAPRSRKRQELRQPKLPAARRATSFALAGSREPGEPDVRLRTLPRARR